MRVELQQPPQAPKRERERKRVPALEWALAPRQVVVEMLLVRLPPVRVQVLPPRAPALPLLAEETVQRASVPAKPTRRQWGSEELLLRQAEQPLVADLPSSGRSLGLAKPSNKDEQSSEHSSKRLLCKVERIERC